MPLAFLAFGTVFLVAAIRGTVSDGPKATPGLVTLIKGDFTGPHNFFVWIIALWIAGAVGYIPGFRPISVAFLTLIILMIFLHNGGFVSQFNAAFAGTQAAGAGSGSTFGPGSLGLSAAGSPGFGSAFSPLAPLGAGGFSSTPF